MVRMVVVAFVGAVISGGAAMAANYECHMKVGGSNDVIPEIILIEHDAAKGEAMAIDPYIKHYYGKPIPAQIVADNAKRTTFAWNFENIASTEGPNIPRVRVKLSIIKASREAHATVSFGYGDSTSGFGTCKVE
ncbi:hypothetical protein [Frigidibacter sp. SD6-1]|uniref:hypothetical protein n=1 Tax=Frigidibacter sp. SD6-1 TaxID=3032581 RepID=UPI0024E01A62|nr:hypothetical protein [Frigidibacter sp. SD6-1]